MKPITYTKTDRAFTMTLALLVLFLLISHFTTCTHPEPALAELTEPVQTIDTLSDWDILYIALVQVESEDNPNAVNPKSGASGEAQILPIYVKDANRIIGEDKYTLECRFSPELSREMFEVVQSHYNPDKSIKKAVKLHNPKAGQWYEDRVMREMTRIKADIAQLRIEMDSVNTDLLDFFE